MAGLPVDGEVSGRYRWPRSGIPALSNVTSDLTTMCCDSIAATRSQTDVALASCRGTPPESAHRWGRNRDKFLPGKEPALPTAKATADNGYMTSSPEPGRLGTFLKACRAQLSPGEVGVPETSSPRKVHGLRREEVAQLAVISV